MSFDPVLADRVRQLVSPRRHFAEKRMFGGVGFLYHDHLVLALWKDSLIVRIGPERYEAALLEPHVREFDVTGRPMKGWVMVAPRGVATENDLRSWLERSLDFAAELPKKKPRTRRRST